MKNWAQYLINHNMRFILYIIWAIVLPFYMVINLIKCVGLFWGEVTYDLRAIKIQKKTK